MNLNGPLARRIHIVGGPGAGKSTLARRLASKLDTESHKLDDIAFDPQTGAAKPLSSRIRGIDSIAAKSAWVAEGVYLGWTDPLLAFADFIVWLDAPMGVALLRKFPHHLKRSLTAGYPHAGMRNQMEHTYFLWHYYTSSGDEAAVSPHDDRLVTRAATARALQPFAYKVVRCQTTDEIDSLHNHIE